MARFKFTLDKEALSNLIDIGVAEEDIQLGPDGTLIAFFDSPNSKRWDEVAHHSGIDPEFLIYLEEVE